MASSKYFCSMFRLTTFVSKNPGITQTNMNPALTCLFQVFKYFFPIASAPFSNFNYYFWITFIVLSILGLHLLWLLLDYALCILITFWITFTVRSTFGLHSLWLLLDYASLILITFWITFTVQSTFGLHYSNYWITYYVLWLLLGLLLGILITFELLYFLNYIFYLILPLHTLTFGLLLDTILPLSHRFARHYCLKKQRKLNYITHIPSKNK